MRKRGARGDGEHSSSRKLWSLLALSVVSVGLTTSAACRGHVTAPVQPLQSSEPVGELLHRDGVRMIGRPSPDEFPPAPSNPSIGPESTATGIKQAIVGCNIAKLRLTILNYSELVALTASRSPVEADYKALVEEWIEATTREFCFTGKRGGTSELGEPETGNYVAAPAGQKWKQPVMLCQVTLRKLDFATGVQANEAINFTLVDFDHNWRILLRADDP